MAAPVYATAAQYAQSPYGSPSAPADIAARLAVASGVVDELLTSARYAVDNDGAPTDAAVVEAMRDATCAQARYALGTGDDDGTGQRWTSVSIGSASLSGGTAGESGVDARFAPHAVRLLRLAGLVPGTVLTEW